MSDLCNTTDPLLKLPEQVGFNTNIKKAMDAIGCGVSPTIWDSQHIYVLSDEFYELGSLLYTKFERNLTPLYSVKVPFSTAYTVGEIIMRGEGYRDKVDPVITEVPNPPSTTPSDNC